MVKMQDYKPCPWFHQRFYRKYLDDKYINLLNKKIDLLEKKIKTRLIYKEIDLENKRINNKEIRGKSR